MELERLSCIDLDEPRLEGFTRFISAWVYRSDELCFLVDPGPLSTIPHLLKELEKRGVKRLDYILLTHIHIDHAGGTGRLLESFPAARVICHPKGIRHLVDPEKLWQGSLKVLGHVAEVYGEIIPVPAENIGFDEEFAGGRLKAYLTPGHAQHHLCFLFDDELLFGGEVVGVRSPVRSGGIYMRPATPPVFKLEIALDSIERMIKLAPRYLVIAHYGLVEPALEYLEIGRRQLKLWVEGVAENCLGREDEECEERLFNWLLEHDPNYRLIRELPDEVFARERYFLGNTMRGMLGYLKTRDQGEG
jgi:glyoxylase-like metal-dependent hydrolase (beta-lactamase superfamily II)